MKRVFDMVGVDYRQWRALARAYVLVDYAAMFGAYGAAETRRAALRLFMLWVFMSLLGLGMATVVAFAVDPLLAAILVITSTMLWTGLVIIAQPANLAAPEDQEIVGFRPVDSRTLFAVRVTALLAPAAETLVMIGWLPVLAFLVRADGSIAMAAAAALAMTAASAWSTLGIVAIFGVLIRAVAPEKLTRMLTYATGIAGIALSGAVIVAINYFAESDSAAELWRATVPRDARTMWFPAAWFASYVTLAGGAYGPAETAGALLSIAALAAVAWALKGRMSSEYIGRVVELTTRTRPHAAPRGRSWRFLGAERRAVALLVSSHLRSDVRFQLSIASSLIMGCLFGLMMPSAEWSFSLPADPFETSQASPVALFAVMLVPSQIYQAMVISGTCEAAWIYFSTPADRTALIGAGRDAIGALVIAPITLALAMFYSLAFGDVVHALLAAAAIGLMAYGAFQLNVLLTPRLPFSVPMAGNRSGGFPAFTSIVVMLIVAPVFIAFQFVAYRNPPLTSASFLCLILGNALLNWLTRRLIPKKIADPDYSR
jgi:hypothetical protein